MRDEDGCGGGVDALFSSGDSNLAKNLVFVERDTSDDIRSSLTLSLPLGRGDLVDVSVKSDDTNKIMNKNTMLRC